jgi:tRNA (guanine6-N2)-methyltransferase
MQFFAITTRGLESLSAAELSALPGAADIHPAYRRLTGCYDGDLAALGRLRTLDDIFMTLAGWSGVGRERAYLADFTRWSQAINIKARLGTLAQLRPIPRQPVFSVTANFVGKRNYTMPEIKAAVAAGINGRYPAWHYTPDDRGADLNIRIFIDHTDALVGLRIGDHPLHRRPYKQAHTPGSLKPTVAAAMLRLADLPPASSIVDPFCGSGTIVAEAAAIGLRAWGGDINPEPLASARINTGAMPRAAILHEDARRLPLATGSVDGVVSNLPWGRQITVNEALHALYRTALAEMRRITRPGGRLILLTSHPELLPLPPDDSLTISLYGQNPSIVTYRLA